MEVIEVKKIKAQFIGEKAHFCCMLSYLRLYLVVQRLFLSKVTNRMREY